MKKIYFILLIFILSFIMISQFCYAEEIQSEKIKKLEEKIKQMEKNKKKVQVSDGRILPQGTIELSFNSNSYRGMTPQVGIFLDDNLELLLELGFNDKANEISGSKSRIKEQNSSVSLEYYFPASDFLPFIGVGYSREKTQITGMFDSDLSCDLEECSNIKKNIDNTLNRNNIIFTIGEKYFINDYSSINLSLIVSDGKIDDNPPGEINFIEKKILFGYSIYALN